VDEPLIGRPDEPVEGFSPPIDEALAPSAGPGASPDVPGSSVVAPGADDAPAGERAVAPDEAVELIGLIDRLEGVLERSGLAELEVGSGETTIVLRTLAAVAPPPAPVAPAPSVPASGDTTDGRPASASMGGGDTELSRHHTIAAPLTGIYYTAPSPDAAPYVRVGAQIVVGQVIGLIEAMKLYNEIKSDVAGRVVRLVAESGKLVKAKQALIEVEPS